MSRYKGTIVRADGSVETCTFAVEPGEAGFVRYFDFRTEDGEPAVLAPDESFDFIVGDDGWPST